jgi:hypothetical protein
MRSKLMAMAAAGALSLCSSSPSFAGSVTQPGELVGLAIGAPLPPGFYFVNTADWGCRDTDPNNTCSGVTIPVIAWSTPWTILGGRLQFIAATPALESGVVDGGPYNASWYNPAFFGQLAWDLGGGWGVSYRFGAYFDVHDSLAWSDTSLNHAIGVSYTANGWNLTAAVVYMNHADHFTDRPQISACPAPFPANGCNPDALNLDLTATKKFGKWEFGPVAYASWDLNHPSPQYQLQRQWNVGGLVGYDFGPVTLQTYLTTGVSQDNFGGNDTRLWTRVILPLGNPFPTPAAPMRKY